MELGGFEPPTSWVRCKVGGEQKVARNMLLCRAFLMSERRLQKDKYAGI